VRGRRAHDFVDLVYEFFTGRNRGDRNTDNDNGPGGKVSRLLWFRLVPFEELHRPLMLLSRPEIVKGSEVLALSCLGIFFA
jgi:hypothetical protein